MTPKERLTRTLQSLPVDRPPVNFYELNGYDQNPDDPNPLNIYNDPSWRSLIELTRHQSDRIVLCRPPFKAKEDGLITRSSSTDAQGSLHTIEQIKTPDRILTRRTRRDRDIDTVWETEHFIKDIADLEAYLSLPDGDEAEELDISGVLRCEEVLGDSGLAAIDTEDALCAAASLFSMADYTIFAMTEQELFTELLEKEQKRVLRRIRAISEALPGRLYRIYGPEYAAPPYLPPSLFHEYVVRYDSELVRLIHASGGYARIHSHGNLSKILDHIASMDADALDPVEPPSQGDVSLRFVREQYGKQLVLFGNIELSEIEGMETQAFTERVKQALAEGMEGEGRGFVLMPSSCPIGRKLSERTLRHYEIMVTLAEKAMY